MGKWLLETCELPQWVMLLSIATVIAMFAYTVYMTHAHRAYEDGLYAFSKADAEKLEAAYHRILKQQATIAVLKGQLSSAEKRATDLARRARLACEDTTLPDKRTRVMSSRKPHPDQWEPDQ